MQGALELTDGALMRSGLDINVVGPFRTIRSVMSAWRLLRLKLNRSGQIGMSINEIVTPSLLAWFRFVRCV